MKKLLMLIVIGIIVSLSSVALAGEYNSKSGITAMQDRVFQLEQQYQICKDSNTKAEDIKECYLDCKESYDMFIEYMSNEEYHDPIFNLCLEDALKEFWYPEKNTADWFLVMGYTVLCHSKIME
jgi:hypothetical protein